eukprot:1140698-Pelagomonas_calceolata.AAC.1
MCFWLSPRLAVSSADWPCYKMHMCAPAGCVQDEVRLEPYLLTIKTPFHEFGCFRLHFVVEGIQGLSLLSQCAPFSLIDVGHGASMFPGLFLPKQRRAKALHFAALIDNVDMEASMQKAKSLASKLTCHAIQRLTTITNTRHAFHSRGLMGEGLLVARQRRAGEEESGRPGAWQPTHQIPISSCFWLSPRLA